MTARGVPTQHFYRTKTLKAQMPLTCSGLVNICLQQTLLMPFLPFYEFLKWRWKCSALVNRNFRDTGSIWGSNSDVTVLDLVLVQKPQRYQGRLSLHSVPCYCYWLLSCSCSKIYYMSIPDTSGQAHTYDIWSFMFYLQQNVSKGNYRQLETKLKCKCKNICSSQPTFRCVKQDLKPLPVNLPDSWACVSASMWQ